jgi:D-alanine transaminase
MPRIAYVNGRYVPHAQATVHVEDRGYQFADGVYEVTAIRGGRFVDLGPHLDRLWRNLGELGIAPPVGRAALVLIHEELRRRNLLTDGGIYLQITRGVAPRDFPFPAGVRPSLVLTAKWLDWDRIGAMAARGVAVVSRPDIRWGRCDIKTVALLPAVLAKQAAREAGAFEAILVDRDGLITEGSSSNFWVVTADGRLVTRSLSAALLPGITRQTLLGVAARAQIAVEERAFTLAEARAAREAFVTSASSFVMPVVTLDGAPIGEGRPGPLARRLRELYLAETS